MKFHCGFRKGYSLQHCLLFIIDKWKRVVDINKIFDAVLTDLSEAFNCICHDFLIAELKCLQETQMLFQEFFKSFNAFSKRGVLMNAIFKIQFNYCAVICMLHNRCLNMKINRLHERCLEIIYKL